MKFLIDANELKKLMKTVKKVFSLYASRDAIQRVCLLQGDPKENTLTLEFALNDSFISHTFIGVEFSGQEDRFKRSVDLSSIADMTFSDPLLELTLDNGNVIFFKSGSLSGKLLVSSNDVEKAIEKARPDSEWTYDYQFKLLTFIEAMEAHSYGKHTDSAALERPVRFVAKDRKNVFLSQDRIAACFLRKDEDIESADLVFYPHTMLQILKTLDKSPGFFSYEERDSCWGIRYDRMRIWGPCVSAKAPRQDIITIVKTVRTSDCYAVKVPAADFAKHLSAIKPFFEGSDLKDKEAAPFVTFLLKSDTQLELQVANKRALDVHKEVEVSYSGTLQPPLNQDFVLNYDFVVEFLSSLIKNSDEKNCELEIRWWPYNDEKYPTRGKAVSFSVGFNYFIVSRVNLKARGAAL